MRFAMEENETKKEQRKKCPRCGEEIQLIASCCKEFWYCKKCNEMIGDIKEKH